LLKWVLNLALPLLADEFLEECSHHINH
jgi:hypothetical protein